MTHVTVSTDSGEGLTPLKLGAPHLKCVHCAKSFGRVEHLKRHLLTHSNSRSFRCSVCEKGFSRSDSLLRHQAVHDQRRQSRSSRRSNTGGRACSKCAIAKVRCTYGFPCARCNERSLLCSYPADGPAALTATTSVSSTSPTSIAVENTAVDSSAHFDHLTDTLLPYVQRDASEEPDFIIPSVPSISESLDVHARRRSAQAFDQSVPLAYPTVSESDQSQADDAVSSRPPSISQVSEDGSRGQCVARIGAPDIVPVGHTTCSSPILDVAAGVTLTRQTLNGAGRCYIDSIGARLPKIRTRTTPSLASSLVSATPTSTPAETVTRSPMGQEQVSPWAGSPHLGFLIDNTTYVRISGMFHRLHAADFNSLFKDHNHIEFPTQRAFNTLLALYVENAHQLLPVTHLPLLDLASRHWTLAVAMAAVGCQFYDSEDATKIATAMHDMLHRNFIIAVGSMLVVLLLGLTRDQDENQDSMSKCLDVSCAMLLHCVAMAYSGDDILMERAFKLHHSLSEQCLKIWQNAGHSFEIPVEETHEINENAWHAWADAEYRRRLGYSIWVREPILNS